MTKPIQGGGLFQTWQSPDRSFHHAFLKLDLECEADPDAGVAIIRSHEAVRVAEVESLHKDLPDLIGGCDGHPDVFWLHEDDAGKRQRVLEGLTSQPVFVG
jgi:hypothetical protein